MMEKEIKILFSYHRHNIEWIDMFAERLRPFYEKGQLSIIYDEVTESSKAFSVNQKELLSFDIIVFFISRKFISLNNFVGKEIPKMIPPLQEHGSRIIPVYLENCEWQSISWLREMKLWPSHQLAFSNMSNDEREKFVSRFIKDELKLAGAEDANQKNKALDAHNALQNDFIKFLEKEKGYPRETMWTSNKGGVLDLSIIELGTKKPIVLIEFKVSNKQGVLGRAALDLLHYKKTREITDCFACIVCPSLDKSSEPFEIYKIIDNGYESLLSINDFPAYEDLRRKVGTKRQVSGGGDGSEGKFKEDEKRCIRIIAKWFRENKSLVNRDEAMNEFGVDNDRYDVLMKTMEHYGVVEKVESVMGKNGYAIAFWPSAYAEELARELDEEDKRLNKDREFGGDDFRDDDWQKDFTRFLTEEKGWLVINENERYKTMSIDLSIRDPESKKLIAVIDFKENIDRKIESKAKASFAQFAELELGRYLVTPSTKKSNYSFTIYKCSDRGLVRMQPNDFPAYEEPPDKKLTLDDFEVGLGVDGIEICDKIIDLAGDSNFGLYAEDVDESYANLRLEGSKKTDNVAVQIHKYGENENQIALAVVGPMKGVEVSELKLNDFIDKGKITELSGYKKNIPGEKAWLNGNLPKKGTREKATVYVIQREIVNIPELWNGVGEILNLGVGNIEKLPQGEPEKAKVEPEVVSIGSDCHVQKEALLEERCLNVNLYAKVLSTFFKAAKGEFCFGLFGHWGRGKTYLMKVVSEELRKGSDPHYETIFFSAWKYRTTPEAWVHLYEAFADCLAETRNCVKLLPYLVRTGLMRLGIWPIIICILIFGASLIPLNQYVTGILLPLLSLLGIAGTLFCIRIFFSFRRIAPVIKQYITLKRHGDKLGLQALIGKDLKSLIMGWVPLNIFKGSFLKLGLIYLVVVSLVGFLLFPIKPQGLSAWLSISTGTHGWLSWLVFSIWLILSIGVMFFVIFGERKTKQLLLVIDDLDRCKPEQMLEIMESLKLLLEEQQIHDRIQVVMLVDEEMLCYAIQNKFTDFIKNNNSNSGTGNNESNTAIISDKIVNEHIEKLFACYLRLPELQLNEIIEVTRRYVEAHSVSLPIVSKQPKITDKIEPEKPSQDGLQGTRTPMERFIEEETSEPRNEIELTIADTVYTNDEKKLLVSTIPIITSQDKTRVWGPRSIRALLFKYQLGRLLLTALKINFTPKELVDELKEAIYAGSPSDREQAGESDNIKRVIEQVL